MFQFSLAIHHDWTIPGNGLLQRLAGNEQKAEAQFAGFHGDLIAPVELNERAIAGALPHHDSAPSTSFSVSTPNGREAPRNEPEPRNVREGMPFGLDRQNLAPSGGNPNIEVARIGGDTLDGPAPSPKLAAHNTHARAVVVDNLRDFRLL